MSNIRGNFYLDIAQGKIAGHTLKAKFGRNPAVGTDGFDAIWNGGGFYTGFNATEAETVTVISSEAEDNSSGTGLRTIRLYGLDENYLEQTEDLELNGTTAVTSSLSYIRLDTARGLTAGSTGSNIGDITIAQSITTSVVFAVLPIGYNSTMVAAYTVPAGKTGYVISQRSGIANKQSAAAEMRFQIRQPAEVFTVMGSAALNSTGTGYIEQDFPIFKAIPEKSDVYVEAEASATVAITAFFDILLIDN